MNEKNEMVLEKVECLISFSLWRNLSLEILSRKLRNDDQASSMWQQQKSKQTAAHATPMPHPHFFSGQISSVFKQSFQEPCLLPPLHFLHRLWSHFLCFFCGPAHFSKTKIGPSLPRLLFTNNWISMFFWIQDATCLNTIRDLEKLSTCASQFVICWPFQTSPQSLHFL